MTKRTSKAERRQSSAMSAVTTWSRSSRRQAAAGGYEPKPLVETPGGRGGGEALAARRMVGCQLPISVEPIQPPPGRSWGPEPKIGCGATPQMALSDRPRWRGDANQSIPAGGGQRLAAKSYHSHSPRAPRVAPLGFTTKRYHRRILDVMHLHFRAFGTCQK